MAASDGMRRRVNLMSMGHPKHGKSSLMGALIHSVDTKSRAGAEGEWSSLFASWQRQPWWKQDMAFAFILDRTKEERVPSAEHQRRGQSVSRSYHNLPIGDLAYTVVDSPGHLDLFRVFLVSFSQADLGILVVAADGAPEAWRTYEELQQKGIRDWRWAGGAWVHSMLAGLFGLNDVIVVISKMDRVGYSKDAFEQAKGHSLEAFASLADLGLRTPTVIPTAVSPAQLQSYNVSARRDETMSWFTGGPLEEVLGTVRVPTRQTSESLCLQVGDVRPLLGSIMIAGEIISGSVAIGDDVMIASAELQRPLTSRVKRIVSMGDPAFLGLGKVQLLPHASAGEIVAIDCGLDSTVQELISGGAVVTSSDAEVESTRNLTARIFIIRSISQIRVGTTQLDLQLGTYRGPCRVTKVLALDQSIQGDDATIDVLSSGDLVTVSFELDEPIALNRGIRDPHFRRIVLLQQGFLVGGGTLINGDESVSS